MDYVLGEFNITSVFFSIDSIAALYNTGKTTGLILDSGDSLTRLIPVLDG